MRGPNTKISSPGKADKLSRSLNLTFKNKWIHNWHGRKSWQSLRETMLSLTLVMLKEWGRYQSYHCNGKIQNENYNRKIPDHGSWVQWSWKDRYSLPKQVGMLCTKLMVLEGSLRNCCTTSSTLASAPQSDALGWGPSCHWSSHAEPRRTASITTGPPEDRSMNSWDTLSSRLSDPTEITPPYREAGVGIPLSHCVSCGIADYRCYTPTSSLKMAYRNPKTGLTRGVSQEKLASEAYRAIGGVAGNSIANRAIVGH